MRQNLTNQPQLFDPKTGGVSLLALIGHTAPAPTYPGFIWSDGNLIFSPKKTVPAAPIVLEQAKELTALEQCKVGTIFSHSWGWEQTNIDFYEVVKITAATLVMREIASTKIQGDMVATETPQPGVFVGPEKRKTPEIYRGAVIVGMKYGSCHVWDGKPQHSSSYA